jgi:hypothetical protein
MNIRLLINLSLFFLSPLFLNWSLCAQVPDDKVIAQLNLYFDQTYGLDQKLISGIEYYSLTPRALGNEFLGTGEFADGRLIINGKEYTNVKIRYDIYNQRINLHFNYDSMAANTVIIENYKIDEFEMNGMLFRKSCYQGYDTSFYQVVSEGRISCIYYWYKSLTLQTSPVNVYEYSEPRRKSYLLVDSTLSRYSSKQTFLKLFDENKLEIRKYIREHQIKLRHSSDDTVAELISFCNSLSYRPAEE